MTIPNAEMREKARQCFSAPGFARMLSEIWLRFASLERAGGHAIVRRATSEECEAIGGFFAQYYKPGTDIRVPLDKFEAVLGCSPFPFTIPDLHEILTGKPLLTRSDRKIRKETSWRKLFDAVRTEMDRRAESLHPLVSAWLEGLEQEMAPGYRTVKELLQNPNNPALEELVKAAFAWHLLLTGEAAARAGLDDKIALRLPVLAAIATGDAHALDRSEPAGRLFFQALQTSHAGEGWDEEGEAESSAEALVPLTMDTLKVRRIYRESGIADDDLSTFVHLYDPSAMWGEAHTPIVATLKQIEEAVEIPVVEDVWIVENPSIFATLAETAHHERVEGECECTLRKVLLLCTSGPASAAALRLLDRLIDERTLNGTLFYSGDFDIKGIEMGNVLATRYKKHFMPWRFDAECYFGEIAAMDGGNLAFTAEEKERLRSFSAVWDSRLTGALAATGYKLFQEQFILQLLADWRKRIRGG